MGAVVGEKFVRAATVALEENIPLVCFAASGARMQEALFSLMQMAKTSAALEKLKQHGVPYISVLTDPVFGGVSASLAMLGDLNIAEPNALIGFAGPRVIEQTVRETLPEGFQRSEFLLEHGTVDMIVHRHEMRARVGSVLRKLTHHAATPVSSSNPDDADVVEPIVEEDNLAETADVTFEKVEEPKKDTTTAKVMTIHAMPDSLPSNSLPTLSLDQWLHHLETLHPVGIDMGLERVSQVARRMGLLLRPIAPCVITVAGTNGKGSTLAMIESVARAHGQRVGTYTSPHLLRYNERVKIDGQEADDQLLIKGLSMLSVLAYRMPKSA